MVFAHPGLLGLDTEGPTHKTENETVRLQAHPGNHENSTKLRLRLAALLDGTGWYLNPITWHEHDKDPLALFDSTTTILNETWSHRRRNELVD